MCPPQTQLVLGLEMGPTWRKCIIGRRPKTSQTQLPVPFLLSIVKQCDQSSFCSSHALSVMMVCSPLHCVPTELSLLCFQLVISHEQSNSFIAFLCDAEFYGSSVFKVYQMREWPGRCQFCLSLLQRLREKQTNNKAKKNYQEQQQWKMVNLFVWQRYFTYTGLTGGKIMAIIQGRRS